MSSNEYVKQIKASNPSLFSAAKIQISPGELENQIRLAFLSGKEAGLKEGPKEDIFTRIFGK